MKRRRKKIGGVRLISRFILFWIFSVILFSMLFVPSCSILTKKSPQKYMESAKKYSDKKDYQKSYKNYSKAIEGNNSLFIAYWERALVDIKMDSLENALADMGIYIDSNPEKKLLSKAYIQRAEIMLKLGYRVESCDDYESACNLNQDNAPFACEQYRLKCK